MRPRASTDGYTFAVVFDTHGVNPSLIPSMPFDTRRDLSKARYDVIVNGLKLRQASGQLQPQDLRAIDALLAR